MTLDPEASAVVNRVQKRKALERYAEPPPPSVAPSLGTRLRALLRKPLKLGAKSIAPTHFPSAGAYFASSRRNTASCFTAIANPAPA